MDLASRHTQWLRRNAAVDQKINCILCGQLVAQKESLFKSHLESNHQNELDAATASDIGQSQRVSDLYAQSRQPRVAPEAKESCTPPPPEVVSDKAVSPPSSLKRASAGSASHSTKRSRGQDPAAAAAAATATATATTATTPNDDGDFKAVARGNGTLFDPASGKGATTIASQRGVVRSPAASQHRPFPRKGQRGPVSANRTHAAQNAAVVASAQAQAPDDTEEYVKEPETRPISTDQLIMEVRGIYSGLVMIESKAIEVDAAQAAQKDPLPKLKNDQWQALIALHRTLLHEHHDFFLASQHPSASPSLQRLPSKYAMPARMWRHGIHSFLEVLRHRLPASLDHMLSFIYLAYSMIALLYETVPAFEGTWIECLGDLGRYRMAIEDDDIRDRENWSQVSRHWYSLASDKAPTVGRLYHHLAILARPNAVQQLFYYSKSLCVPVEFDATRESIMTLFDPILNPSSTLHSRLPEFEVSFVRWHAINFIRVEKDKLTGFRRECLTTCDAHVGKTTRRFLETGHYIAIANSCAIIGYGHSDNAMMKIMKKEANPTKDNGSTKTISVEEQMMNALDLTNAIHDILFQRFSDPNTLGYIHASLVFMTYCSTRPALMDIVAPTFPWGLLAAGLNTLMMAYKTYSRIEPGSSYPVPEEDNVKPRPLPETWAMRELLYADFTPSGFFANDKLNEDDKMFEVASMFEDRREIILWYGGKLSEAANGKYLAYNRERHEFSVSAEREMEMEEIQKVEQIKIEDTDKLEEAKLGDVPEVGDIRTDMADERMEEKGAEEGEMEEKKQNVHDVNADKSPAPPQSVSDTDKHQPTPPLATTADVTAPRDLDTLPDATPTPEPVHADKTAPDGC